jgi:hypothetical protein
MWSAVVRLVGRTAKLSKTRRLMVEKLTLNYLATALVAIPAVSMPIDKTAHFRSGLLLSPGQGATM